MNEMTGEKIIADEKGKKLFSTILLTVGALFIVISGGIFVSRTWQYLPEILKKFCLVAVSGAFFAGSRYLEKNTKLKKTPLVFYYLGVCFVGFSVLSFLTVGWMDTAQKMTLAMGVMLVPVVYHFLQQQNLLDFVFGMLLSDGMVLCISQFSVDSPEGAFSISISVLTMLLTGFVYYCKEYHSEEKLLVLVAEVACWVHMAFSAPWVLGSLLIEESFFYCVLPVLMMAASLTAIYMSNKNIIYRVFQSASMYLCILSLVLYVGRILPYHDSELFEPEMFVTFLAGLALFVLLDRVEMFLISGVLTVVFSLSQVFTAIVDGYLRADQGTCYPYALLMAAAIVLRHFLKDVQGDTKTVVKNAGIWLAMGANSLLSRYLQGFARDYGMAFWFAIFLLLISSLLKEEKIVKAFLRTLSMFAALTALCSNPILPVEFFNEDGDLIVNFHTEYTCILLGLGIVLFGKICYDVIKRTGLIQFIGICLLIFVLVCRNLAVPALPNVLFLGIAMLIMLVAASALHRKEYALAAAITLILVVLYLTKEVWMSIAWWVYLFVAGVGLVIYAIKREKAE